MNQKRASLPALTRLFIGNFSVSVACPLANMLCTSLHCRYHQAGIYFSTEMVFPSNTMQQFFFQPDNMPFLEIRTTLDSVMSYNSHFHTHFSVGIILEGQTHFFLNGESHLAEKGNIVLIAPRQVHSCNPINGLPRSYHMLFFDASWFEENVIAPLWGNHKICVNEPVITDINLFSQGISLIASACSGFETTDVFSYWLSIILSQAETIAQPRETPKTNKLITEALPSMDANISCNIAALATKAQMRRESYSRLVKRNMGLSPQACLHCLRIEKGRLLLRQGKTIAEAAFETGYTDQSHFHRMFQRIVCATPGCYQKKRSHPYNT